MAIIKTKIRNEFFGIPGPYKHPDLPTLACKWRKVLTDLQAHKNITKEGKHEEERLLFYDKGNSFVVNLTE